MAAAAIRGTEQAMSISAQVLNISLPSPESILSDPRTNVSRCEYTGEPKGLYKPGFWRQHILIWSTRYSWVTEAESIVFLRMLLRIAQDIEEVIRDCVQGVIVVMLLSMDAVECRPGTSEYHSTSMGLSSPLLMTMAI
ncbi:hypothetical protein FOZ62_032462 [Perkinsus olseni]|uniref:Uncharacterized protein n=1 Tax=Perkinsus olseni TaxID=32597 RepID=A0A7J6T1E6_PEROL|nr:hypothetical protein FOZ62_032462 [Perkinsus olseni]